MSMAQLHQDWLAEETEKEDLIAQIPKLLQEIESLKDENRRLRNEAKSQ